MYLYIYLKKFPTPGLNLSSTIRPDEDSPNLQTEHKDGEKSNYQVRLFVGGLSYKTTDSRLEAAFAPYGRIL